MHMNIYFSVQCTWQFTWVFNRLDCNQPCVLNESWTAPVCILSMWFASTVNWKILSFSHNYTTSSLQKSPISLFVLLSNFTPIQCHKCLSPIGWKSNHKVKLKLLSDSLCNNSICCRVWSPEKFTHIRYIITLYLFVYQKYTIA